MHHVLENNTGDGIKYQCHLFPICQGRFSYTFRACFSRLYNQNWVWRNKPNEDVPLIVTAGPLIHNQFQPTPEWLSLVYKWFQIYSSNSKKDTSAIYPICLIAGFSYYYNHDMNQSKELINMLCNSYWVSSPLNIKRLYMLLFDESFVNVALLINMYNSIFLV